MLLGVGLLLLGLFLLNNSWLAPVPDGEPTLFAHRGVHQTFDPKGVTDETCTAKRIDPPRHKLIENSLPSMAASFAAGADVIELDVHPTTDSHFVVFHDWTLDCRTDGQGVTREQTLAYLKSLDIGYGYTHDGGRSFPLRGTGRGMMPTLAEAIRAFPDGRFLINIKSRDAMEADRLADYLRRHDLLRGRPLLVYGDQAPVERLTTLLPQVRGFSRATLKACALRYLAAGWTGHVPEACRGTLLLVPLDYRHLLWGWPNHFLARMRAVGTEVVLTGALEGGKLTGIDRPDQLDRVPDRFDGGIWTEAIERIGPAVKARTLRTRRST